MSKKNNQLLKSRNEFLKREELRKQQELKRKKEKRRKTIIICAQIAGVALLIVLFWVLFYFANRDKNPTAKAACDGCSGKVPYEICDCRRQCSDKDCKCIENPIDPSPLPAPKPPDPSFPPFSINCKPDKSLYISP